MRFRKTAFLACVAILAGCSSIAGVYDDVAHQIAPADATRFYVAKAGVTLYEEPGFSSPEVARLAVDEAVDRDRIENGFAHVRVVGSGKEGWVDNAKLHWRAPDDDAEAASPPTEPEAPEAPAPQKAETQEKAAVPPPAPPAPTPPAPANDPPQAPSKNGNDVNPALFDAF